MPSRLTVRQFFERFPSDDACLDRAIDVRYGMRRLCRKCGADSTFHRLANRRAYSCARRAYSCAHCGDHVYPCAGTIFQDSCTSLQLWLYAIYLFVTTRHGVSGKELERTLGVTYTTAWRMGQQIRDLMDKAEGFALMRGHIELDEAYVGDYRPGKRGRGAAGKTIVMGVKERGGRMHAETIPDIKKGTLREVVGRTVQFGAIVSTRELMSYGLLEGDGFAHGTVKHGVKEYAYGDRQRGVIHHTNHVESFWNLFKNSVRSTHIHVSQKHMNRYLSEFAFRSNHWPMENAMFDLLIGAV